MCSDLAHERQKLENSAPKTIKPVYKNHLLQLFEESLVIGKKTLTRAWVKHPGAVVILPILANKKIALIKQYRRAIDEIIIELPAGIIEPDENPKDTASRELQEEIGYYAHEITYLLEFYATPGFCNEKIRLYLAQNLEKKSLDGDEDEAIDVFELDEEEIKRYIKNRKIIDAKTLTALLYYLNLKSDGKI